MEKPKGLRDQVPEIGTAVAVVSFAFAIMTALLTATGAVALGIPPQWWSLIFFVVGSAVSIGVIVDQRKRLARNDLRRASQARNIARRDRRIQELEAEVERLKHSNQELTQRITLETSRPVVSLRPEQIGANAEPVTNVPTVQIPPLRVSLGPALPKLVAPVEVQADPHPAEDGS